MNSEIKECQLPTPRTDAWEISAGAMADDTMVVRSVSSRQLERERAAAVIHAEVREEQFQQTLTENIQLTAKLDEVTNALSNAAREHDALDHVMRVAREGVQPTRRLDWIVKRAERALAGKEPDNDDRPPENSVLKMSKAFADCRERLREQSSYAERNLALLVRFRSLAAEAAEHLDADRDVRCLKLLMAMCGSNRGYRADIDEIHAALAENPSRTGSSNRARGPETPTTPPGALASKHEDAGVAASPVRDGVLTGEFQIFDGDDFYADVSGPREQAWGEAMRYASQCEGRPRIEEITRRLAPMGEVPPGYFPHIGRIEVPFGEGYELFTELRHRHPAEAAFRRLLAMRLGVTYGDDGELQCGEIDMQRNSVEEIEVAIDARGIAQLVEWIKANPEEAAKHGYSVKPLGT